jgi:DUF3047 family protein
VLIPAEHLRGATLECVVFEFGFWRTINARVGLILAALLGLVAATSAERVIVIEDWMANRLSQRGIPSGWTGEGFGQRADYDFTIEQGGEARVLHLKSQNEHSTIVKDITGKVRLKETPILEWTWKVSTLPAGGDVRRKESTDIAAQLYVIWPRFPTLLRSRIIGYIWDATTPAATMVKSQKTGTVTFIVLRSGTKDVGKWISERRNVAEDYRDIFGEIPEDPAAITISIDSNDTHSAAESLMGPIFFREK